MIAPLTLLMIALSLPLIAISGVTILNTLTFPRLKRPAWRLPPAPPAAEAPLLSILIPARNEAATIGTTVRLLLGQQSAGPFEVIILDDGSTDGTAAAAQQAAHRDTRLKIIDGGALPEGWLGKNWACWQLSQAASGDLLLFCDADVRWAGGALAALLTERARTQADLLAIWPTQQTITWGERLTVPLIALVIMGYLPVLATHHLRSAAFAAANGQCLLFRRQAYEAVGGHQAVRDEIVEDIVLARRVIKAGLRLRIADGAGLIGCRMYENWPAARDGFAKNITAGYGESLAALAAATIFHWAVFMGPWLLLIFGPGAAQQIGWPGWPLALIGLGVGTRALSAAATRQRTVDALLMPVSVLLMTIIAGRSAWWYLRYGGPFWKGRALPRRHKRRPQA